MKKYIQLMALACGIVFVSGCADEADIVDRNMDRSTDNFEVARRVVFYNGITGEFMLTVEGYMSLEDQGGQLEVIVKTGEREYKRHLLGLSDNVTYFCEQIETANLSPNHYRVVFKPSVIIPALEIR